MVPISSLSRGLMIGRSSPACMASARNVRFKSGRFGRPKETLETPKTVCTPSFFTISIAFSVSFTSFCCAEAVRVRQSMIMSSFPMPYSAAFAMIFCAISNLSSAFRGIPSSNVRPITTPPYFFTIGKMASMTSSFPLTELISGFPL